MGSPGLEAGRDSHDFWVTGLAVGKSDEDKIVSRMKSQAEYRLTVDDGDGSDDAGPPQRA